MKFNGKSIAFTTLLVIILLAVIFIEIALFITGPSAKYDAKVEKQIQNIQKNYEKIENIQRHVFHYIIYIGEDLQFRIKIINKITCFIISQLSWVNIHINTQIY